MKWLAATALLALAACGIDGDPVAPSEVETIKPGISVSGSVEMGITQSR